MAGHESSTTADEFSQYEQLFDRVRTGNRDAVKEFLHQHPNAVRVRNPSSGKTPLHIAVTASHVDIVEDLVQLMSEKDLEIKGDDGKTGLSVAADIGLTQIAQVMVRKNKKILSFPNAYDLIPVVSAYLNRHWEMASYLYSVTPLDHLRQENGPHGATIVSQCFYLKIFGSIDIALDLIKHCPELVITRGYKGASALYAFTLLPASSLSGTGLRF